MITVYKIHFHGCPISDPCCGKAEDCVGYLIDSIESHASFASYGPVYLMQALFSNPSRSIRSAGYWRKLLECYLCIGERADAPADAPFRAKHARCEVRLTAYAPLSTQQIDCSQRQGGLILLTIRENPHVRVKSPHLRWRYMTLRLGCGKTHVEGLESFR